MKSINSLLLVIVVSSIVFGCSKSSSKSSSDYIDATINGVTYHEDILSDVHAFFDGQSASCDKLTYRKEFLNGISTSNFDIQPYIKFYISDSAFNNRSKTGTYIVGNDQAFPENTCNLTFLLSYYDQSLKKYFTLLPGGVHTVTSISKGGSSATSQDYVIVGTYNCKFVNPTTKDTLSCSGSYQKTIETLKP